MFSAITALRFSGLQAAPAVAPAVRFAAANDAFISRVRFGNDDEEVIIDDWLKTPRPKNTGTTTTTTK